ncbi:MAG: hypothetical protein GX800_03175, partial [Clostridiaceae bacterium]|nr:hypothetical protein [Clostridiaceae bacterium]
MPNLCGHDARFGAEYSIVKDECGEGFLDVLIKILITVIIGAALLALLRIAIPDLFQDILDKIRNVFT